MKIKFWGVRGSIASPQRDNFISEKYGGNTPCVQITTAEGKIIVIDMGTGARLLGDHLMGMKPLKVKSPKSDFNSGKGEIYVFLSHFHWDHIQGIPFFKPLYIKGNRMNFYGDKGCRDNLQYQMKRPFFPVEFEDTLSDKKFTEFKNGGDIWVGKTTITAAKLDHTDDVYGFRVKDGGKVFTYASDVEHNMNNTKNLTKLAEGADALLYDCQYTYMEYDPKQHGVEKTGKQHWGHSIIQEGIRLSADAGVKMLIAFHHNPESDDEKISDITAFANTYKKDHSPSLEILAAYEGLELEL